MVFAVHSWSFSTGEFHKPMNSVNGYKGAEYRSARQLYALVDMQKIYNAVIVFYALVLVKR